MKDITYLSPCLFNKSGIVKSSKVFLVILCCFYFYAIGRGEEVRFLKIRLGVRSNIFKFVPANFQTHIFENCHLKITWTDSYITPYLFEPLDELCIALSNWKVSNASPLFL